jgi:hypothetical protein
MVEICNGYRFEKRQADVFERDDIRRFEKRHGVGLENEAAIPT